MAREHPAGDHALHPRRQLTYALTAIGDGPWPDRLAIGPLPVATQDLADIRNWGAERVLVLVTDGEVRSYGIDDIAGHYREAGLHCNRAPLDDYTAPDAGFDRDWVAIRRELIELLADGGKVLIHCKAGKGRSGTLAAALLVAGGLSATDAIAAVRRHRPGAIETAAQEDWVHNQTAHAASGAPLA